MRNATIIGFLLAGANMFLDIVIGNYVALFGWICCVVYLFGINAKDKDIDSLQSVIDAQDQLLKSYEKMMVSRNTDNPESSDF